ncbi:ABC transporter permease [Macrococcoides bohemicum]|uniref:ABC transporter permease n=1 Tax=Macrococcoides bohemicum TaxID=1903056 RepID=UPI0028A14F3C|nr:ABC transporter permease [Macrococcus bohemicus]
MFHNALLYVIRKRQRSLIVFVILSVVLSCLFICLSVLSTTDKQKDKLNELTIASLIVTRKDGGDFNKNRIKHAAVKTVIPMYSGSATVKGAHVVEGRQKVKRDDVPSTLKNVVAFEASVDTEHNVLFQSGVFTLKSGHHVKSGDKTGVLIHETFAKQNHLKVNDTVQLSQLGKNTMKTFKVRGIFSGKKQEQYTGLSSDFSENMMFVSNRSMSHGVVNKLGLVTDHPDKVMGELERNQEIKAHYTIEKAPNTLEDRIASYNGISQMMRWMTYAILCGGVIVLSLVLVLLLRERIYEIGILLSIGVSKLKIMMQFVLELLLLSIPAAMSAYIAGRIAISLQREAVRLPIFALSYSVLTAIILLSVIIATSVILFKPPRALLSQMS